MEYASRAGEKLEAALDHWGISPDGVTCADLGANAGGFTDCLLKRGAKKVYAIDTAYGALDYGLRNDERVEVMERTNALHAELPEEIGLVAIDTGWTRQKHILPKAIEMVGKKGIILSLVKPQYEAGREAKFAGKKSIDNPEEILSKTIEELKGLGIEPGEPFESPIRGGKGGNTEYWIRVEI